MSAEVAIVVTASCRRLTSTSLQSSNNNPTSSQFEATTRCSPNFDRIVNDFTIDDNRDALTKRQSYNGWDAWHKKVADLSYGTGALPLLVSCCCCLPRFFFDIANLSESAPSVFCSNYSPLCMMDESRTYCWREAFGSFTHRTHPVPSARGPGDLLIVLAGPSAPTATPQKPGGCCWDSRVPLRAGQPING
jgi:hypothetical protein